MHLTDPQTGQWFVSFEGTKWWFDSGSIALDFAYTGSMGDNPSWEQWHTPGDLAAWIDQRFGVQPPVSASHLADAKTLRHTVASLVTAASDGRPFRRSSVRVLDRYAAGPDVAPQLGRRPRPSLEEVLAGIAREAVIILRDQSERIRQCAAGDCQIIYLDTSRSANRMWCSMQRCGNRHKVRQQRARLRALATKGEAR